MEKQRQDSFYRAMACYDACAGIANPAAIPAAIEALERILDVELQFSGSNVYTLLRPAFDNARAALAALRGE